MASTDTWVFLFSILDGTTLLFLTVYFVITLSDLECDYINATQCCSRLNKWIIPELVAQGLLTVIQLLSFHWVIFLLSAPLAAWQIYRFGSTPSGNIGVYDPAEIHNRQLLKFFMKESMVKLAVHLLFFFIYLYCLIVSILS